MPPDPRPGRGIAPAAFSVGVLVAGVTAVAAGVPAAPQHASFRDIAEEAGLTDVFRCGRDDRKDYIIEALGGGVALLDYDRDGHLDAFFVSGSALDGFPPGQHPSSHLYRNEGDGTFSNATDEAGLRSEGWGHGACVGDFDNDGFEDLFVTYLGPNRLFRNTGRASFSDVTEPAGLPSEQRWSTSCAFVDYDRDGWADLFVANYLVFDRDRIPRRGGGPTCRWKGHAVACGPRGLPGETNQLFRNLDGARFREVSHESGVTKAAGRYSLSVTPFDYNGDLWPDIYVAVDSQASILFENNGDGTFTDVGVFAGAALDEHGDIQAGMGSAAADLDGDGTLDLLKTNFIEETSNVYMNSAAGAFRDQVHAMGAGISANYMGWGVAALDFDSDSWPDVVVANGHTYPELEGLVANSPYRQPRLLYRNIGGRELEPVPAPQGSALAARHSGRGLATGDYDNDGDVDVFVNNMNERPSLLRNDSLAAGRFLSVRLIGTKSNRSGIGARVTVLAGERRLVQEVRSGSSFQSSSDLRLHFGLGATESVERVVVDWPHPSARDILTGVRPDQFLEITEGEGITARRPAGEPRR